MGYLNSGPRIEVATGSGVLRVTIHPKVDWLLFFVEVVVGVIIARTFYTNWTQLPLLFRGFLIWAIVGGVAALIYQLAGRAIIEFDQRRLSVCKDLHGWERKKEYNLDECSELEWVSGAERSAIRP